MQVANVVRLASELLKVLSENEGNINDWSYLPIYDEFVEMRNKQVKYRVAVDELSKKHNISKTKIERVIRRFRKEIVSSDFEG